MKQFAQSETLKRLPEQFFATLSGNIQKLAAQGYDVINLGQGNPDQPTPPHIISSLQQAAEKPVNHKYTPFHGFPYLKEAVARFYQRDYGVDIDPETEVAVLFGAKAGLVEMSQCFLNPGDTALVPDPGYPDYWSGIALADGHMEMMPLLPDNHFLPDYEKISQKTWDEAKLMFLNYPNNPTGATAPNTFFEDTVRRAEAHDVCVVHDFAYGTIGFDGQQPQSFLQTPGAKNVGVEIYTLSKSYNMAGWRIGFAVGNPSVIESLELIQDHYYCSLFGGIQEAGAEALLASQQCVRELSDLYEARRNTFISGLQDIGWPVTAPQGSFFTWLPVPEGYTSEGFSNLLLDKAQIGVAPGIGFGSQGESYIRAALLADEPVLKEAIQRIDDLHLF